LFAGNIIEKTKEEGILGGVERRKLEEALTAKQESEAKLASLEMKVKEQEMELTDTKRKVGLLISCSHVAPLLHISFHTTQVYTCTYSMYVNTPYLYTLYVLNIIYS